MIKIIKTEKNNPNMTLTKIESSIVSLINEVNNVKDHINFIEIIKDYTDQQYIISVNTLLYVGIGRESTTDITIAYSHEGTFVLIGFPSCGATIDFKTLEEMKLFIIMWRDRLKQLLEDMYTDIRECNQKNVIRP